MYRTDDSVRNVFDFQVGEEEGIMRVSNTYFVPAKELDGETPPVKNGREWLFLPKPSYSTRIKFAVLKKPVEQQTFVDG